MFWILPILLLTLGLTAANKNIVIWHHTITYDTKSLIFDDVTILKDTSWSILNNYQFDYKKKLLNDASMFITSKSKSKPLKVSGEHSHAELVNNGVIVFNSNSATHASSYKLSGKSFENNGEMYLCTSLSSHISYTYLKAKAWVNNGLIVLHRDTSLKHRAELATGHSIDIRNNGQICLFNHIFAQSGNILGNGCISIDKASKVELKTSVSAKDQIFVLAHSTSILSVPGVHEGTYKVAGFGNGNIISIGLKLAGKGSLPAWEYNQYSGVLTMRHLSYTKHFHIGQGYSHGYFRVVSCDTTNDALTYSGPIPQGSTKSDKCAICPEIAPKAAGSEPETYTTTYVTIIDGKETTAAAIVNVEHNDEGDVHIHSIPIGVTTDAVKDPFTSAFGVVHQAGVGGIGIGTSTTQDSKPTTVPVNKPGINEINYAPVPEEWELQLEQQQ